MSMFARRKKFLPCVVLIIIPKSTVTILSAVHASDSVNFSVIRLFGQCLIERKKNIK